MDSNSELNTTKEYYVKHYSTGNKSILRFSKCKITETFANMSITDEILLFHIKTRDKSFCHNQRSIYMQIFHSSIHKSFSWEKSCNLNLKITVYPIP